MLLVMMSTVSSLTATMMSMILAVTLMFTPFMLVMIQIVDEACNLVVLALLLGLTRLDLLALLLGLITIFNEDRIRPVLGYNIIIHVFT